MTIDESTALGRHWLAELHACDRGAIDDVGRIEAAMASAAMACGATIVQRSFHRFAPQGVSGVLIIAESHMAIHTWPEHGYAAVDLFTCGDSCKPEIAYGVLCRELGAGTASYFELRRGILDPRTRAPSMATPVLLRAFPPGAAADAS